MYSKHLKMSSTLANVVFLAAVIQAVRSGLLTPPPECFAPTACDTSLASCTIGLGCLGSPITMCSIGDLSSNGACGTFPNTNTTYCECESCVGIINEILYYDCSCGGPSEYVCPSGYNLVTCVSRFIPGETRYSCCASSCST